MVAVMVVVPLLGACSGSSAGTATATSSSTTPSTALTASSTTSSTTTTGSAAPDATTSTTGSSRPRIVAFTGPRAPVVCFARDSQVQLHWSTAGATRVTLRIDGGPVFATYRDGTHDELEPITCDGTKAVYTLTATGAAGPPATKSITIRERAPE